MRCLWAVSRNTMKEILRDRILYGLLIFAVLMLFTSLLLGSLSYGEQEKIITDVGLVAVEWGCCMLAIFVGSSLVFREMERQTILLLISKPMRRSEFLLGKFLGLTVVLILVDILVSAFMGFIGSRYGQIHWSQFAVSQIGVVLESLFLLSAAVFFGTFARPALTTIFTLSIWLVGHGIDDLHYFSEKSKSPVLKNVGLVVSRVFPNLNYFNFKEAALYGDPISHAALQQAVLLWVAWFAILLIASIWIFNRRDFI